MAYQSINPNDGNLLARYHDMDGPALEPAPSDAHHCFEVWRRTSYIDRARIVERAAKLLLEDPDGFAGLETLEIGKRIAEARGEVKFSAAILSYYARHTEAFLAPEALEPAAGEAHMENSPLGVIFCVQRWNFPYCQLARVAGPQLMAGNVLLVKHADIAPDNPAFRDEFFGPVASCQRFGLRAGRIGVDAGRRARQPRGESRRYRHDLREQPRPGRCRSSFRRHQAFGVRTRTGPDGHPGVREPEAREDRQAARAGLTPSKKRRPTRQRTPVGRFSARHRTSHLRRRRRSGHGLPR
jgi:hypothetical protein